MKYIEFIEHTWMKLLSILSTFQGWVVAVFLTLTDYVGGNKFSVGLAVAVTLMDAIWGIAVSIKIKDLRYQNWRDSPSANWRYTGA